MKPYVDYHRRLIRELKDPEEAAAYLDAALEDSDPGVFLLALRNVAEAQGSIAGLAKKAGLPRMSVYRITSQNGNPTLMNIAKLINAIGLRLSVSQRRAKRKAA